jgi:dTMP kinase
VPPEAARSLARKRNGSAHFELWRRLLHAAPSRRVHGRSVKRGTLIAFEGLDGSGKSTQLAALVGALRSAGRDAFATCEPTDGPTGARIREMARSGALLPPEEELRWFVEDRRAHVRETLEPALAGGRIAVTDRYFLSSVAYQGARGLDWRRILAESEAEFPLPDLALILELDAAEGLARVRGRGNAIEGVFERKDYLERVAAIFAAIDRPYVERISAAGSIAEVHARVVERVRARLGLL